MKKCILTGFLVWAISAAWPVSSGYAAGPDTQVDALIEKLVDKGILSKDEADVLKSRIVYDAKTIQENNMKTGMPDWVQNTKLTGDFRVRNQWEHRVNDASSGNGRDRGRIRARLGLETKVNDQFKMAVGIATDGGSARSNNQTFDSNFAKGNVVLNYAYGQWIPNDQWTVTGGQMKNPIWEPMEFLWDTDITPTGGAIQYNYKVSDALNAFALGTVFVVKEIKQSNADPFIYVAQAGLKGKLAGEKADYKLVGTYQGVQNHNNVLLPSSTAFNTTASSKYVYRYNQPMGSAEIGFNDPLGENFPVYVPRIAAFGEYTRNPNPRDENTAWMIGGYIGNSTVANKGTWKATWAYKVIGRDAWLDILPDSDFYSGDTDVKGYEAMLEYGLAKNVTFVVDYYRTQRKSSLADKQPESLLQTDINWKF